MDDKTGFNRAKRRNFVKNCKLQEIVESQDCQRLEWEWHIEDYSNLYSIVYVYN